MINFMQVHKFLKMECVRSQRPLSELKLLFNGFFSLRKNYYQFDKYDKNLFLNDWEIEFNLKKINSHETKKYVTDKLYFGLLLQNMGISHLVGLVNYNRFIPLSKYNNIDAALKEHGYIFVKPVTGSGGNGIYVAKSYEECKVRSPHVIELPILQHEYANNIYSGSINTIRVMTIKDSKDIFIAGAFHRFGTNDSGCVDNISKGGIGANIDLNDGIMTAAIPNPIFKQNIVYKAHPNSGSQIEGIKVPYWDEVQCLAIKLTKMFPGLFYVGWDIAVTPNGPVVIEGNAEIANPHPMQAFLPMLKNARIVQFMFNKGVISYKKKIKCNNILDHS